MSDSLTIRPAAASEMPLVLEFIRELAAYERLEDQVLATLADLSAALTGPRPFAEVVFACLDGAPVDSPSIAFYRSLGAVAHDEWTTMRVSDAALENLAAG